LCNNDGIELIHYACDHRERNARVVIKEIIYQVATENSAIFPHLNLNEISIHVEGTIRLKFDQGRSDLLISKKIHGVPLLEKNSNV